MTTASFTPRGPFSLASSIRFLEGFTPASYDHAADGLLRLAFPTDDHHGVVGCALRQKEAVGEPGFVTAEFTVHTDVKVEQSLPLPQLGRPPAALPHGGGYLRWVTVARKADQASAGIWRFGPSGILESRMWTVAGVRATSTH